MNDRQEIFTDPAGSAFLGDDFRCVRGSSGTVKVINLGYNEQTRYSVARRNDRGFALDSGVALVDSWDAEFGFAGLLALSPAILRFVVFLVAMTDLPSLRVTEAGIAAIAMQRQGNTVTSRAAGQQAISTESKSRASPGSNRYRVEANKRTERH